tara:strand:+ start:531 stop:734 length:204 start_codon:yes stop_codon:yes gene_type:complete
MSKRFNITFKLNKINMILNTISNDIKIIKDYLNIENEKMDIDYNIKYYNDDYYYLIIDDKIKYNNIN